MDNAVLPKRGDHTTMKASLRRNGSRWRSPLLLWAFTVLAHACGAREESPATTPIQEGPNFFEPDPAPAAGAIGGTPGVGGLIDEEGSAPESSEGVTCHIEQAAAELVRQPVDIVFLLDNSGSMDDELQAVEENINRNFASILIDGQVDYQVILISRHREEPRGESEEASTSVCVSQPLSALESCEDAGAPAPTERFHHYSTKLESDDSFDVLLDTYAPPFDGSEREDEYDNAPLGWSAWLRPGAKKVFLEVTDDDEDMPAQEFIEALTALAPEHFGSAAEPAFVFHSIVGVAEKDPPTAAYLPDEPVSEDECTGNSGDVTSAGVNYQELSRITGGLRFPLCQFDGFDVVFRRIAEDVVLEREVACDFVIPDERPGTDFALEKIAISYQASAGEAVQFGQARTAAECQNDAFYIDAGRVYLCPETCTTVRRDPEATVVVLFTCENQILIPR